MRIAIINSDYTDFLRWLYDSTPGLAAEPYAGQMGARNASLFGVADFYSHNLRALGHEACELHMNNEPMQRAWAREHGLALQPEGATRLGVRLRGGFVPWVSPVADTRWMYDVLRAQIESFRPDVVLNQIMDGFSGTFLRSLKPAVRLVVGQVASPLSDREDLGAYDLIISSLPNFVTRFRTRGIASELNRFAFDPRVLDALSPQRAAVDLSFVGSVSGHHGARGELLEFLANTIGIDIWGKGAERLPAGSVLRNRHHGPVWGRAMYEVLAGSRITLNHHIGIAGPFANNMRLFEATGAGTLLMTDWKENLHEMFEPGREVVAYRSPGECAELIGYYLKHEEERAAIAHAGQQRTLRDHNYARRMAELARILERHLPA